MTILFSEKSAWRAVYVYRGTAGHLGAQVLHLGLDPSRDGGPSVFGALFLAPRRPGLLGRVLNPKVRFTVPHVRWSLAARSRVALAVYRVQQRLLHGLDGRYGWGTAARKAVR